MKKPHVFLALSLAANAALVTTYLARHVIAPSRPAETSPALPAGGNGFHDASATGLSAADAGALKRSGELMLAGGDLHVLVARLRAAGFSPAVIRGIITAQVAEQFGARRKAAVAHQEVVPYWKSSQSFPYDPKAGAEIASLGREQTTLLRDLLGPDSNASDEWSRLIQERKYGSLSQDKINRLQDIQADYNDMRMQFGAEARGIMLPEDSAKMALLAKEQRADIVKLFTPEELEDYDLRTSNTANQLRNSLTAFNPTEEEFRTLFHLTRAYEIETSAQDSQLALETGSSDGTRRREAAQAQLQAAIEQALGPARAAEYKQSSNPDNQMVNRLLTRLDLPLSLSSQIVSVQQDIQQRANAVRQNSTLSPEQRTSQLTSLLAEAQTRLTPVLGERGYDAYKSFGGWWLRNLVPRPAPSIPPRK